MRVGVGLACLCLMSLVTFVPWRAVDKYHQFRGMRSDVRDLANEHAFGESVVLVRGQRHPDYASAAVYNPVDLAAPETIYAWDRGPDDQVKPASRPPNHSVPTRTVSAEVVR